MDEMSHNLLLIQLAVRLQHLTKGLKGKHVRAERITRKSLAEEYYSLGLSSSQEGARKKSGRYMKEMEGIFGLKGSDAAGYTMKKTFPKFLDMFEFWLEKISPPGKDDKRLHVMLSGLIIAIGNAFSHDPIVVPNLAQQLKQKYGNKNIRDTSQPLSELFDSQYIGTILQLLEGDDESLIIDPDMDPLLLRLKPRSEVGGNEDISINLARPGRIRVIFEHSLQNLDQETFTRVRKVAEAVRDSDIWTIDGHDYLPYILYQEGDDGVIMLTMRNLSKCQYKDIPVDSLQAIPDSGRHYCPFGLDPAIWSGFRQMAV